MSMDRVKFNSICSSCQQFVKHGEWVFMNTRTGAVHHERCLANITTDRKALVALAKRLGYERQTYVQIKDDEPTT